MRNAGLVHQAIVRPAGLSLPTGKITDGLGLSEALDERRNDVRYSLVAWYIDASVAVKLVTVEAETAAMHKWVASNSPKLVTSDLLRTVLLRSGQCIAIADTLAAAQALDAIDYLPATSAIFDLASQLVPSDLGSLDALHLATALDLADDCHGIVTYDNRLAAAAHSDGSEMLSPR
jgi:predicted nucleic acid-binding protein